MKRFVPDSWKLTDRLRQYALDKGLSDNQINDQEEGFRLHQFKQPILDFDRAWMRWIRSAIEWGKVVPTTKVEYHSPQEITEDEKKRDEAKAWAELNRLRGVK